VPGPERTFGLLGVYTRSTRRFTPGEHVFVQALADVLGVAAERKRLEGELRARLHDLAESDRRKDEFLAMLAHELRNPLAPVRNALEIMRMARDSDPQVDRLADMMSRQIGQIARLVDDLLDVSRITRGKVGLRREQVDLNAVASQAVEATLPLVQARRQDLTVAMSSEPIPIDADSSRLAQVMGNLLNNAVKYTDEGGRIWLDIHREGAEAVIRVRDTGVGIAAEMLPLVFDLFTQVDPTLDRSQGGLGVGLTLVKSLVELHGGTVRAFSAGIGQGSEFIVRLPVRAPAGPTGLHQPVASEPAAQAPPQGRRVLIVDDNVDAADSLATLLEMSGHQVHAAYSGLTALDLAESLRPDVVFLDIGLPGLDGYEVARRIRKNPECAGMVLVALTGYGQDEDRRKSQEAGFDQHLVKPVAPRDVVKLLARLREG
jgi:signal transduction histidine kinase